MKITLGSDNQEAKPAIGPWIIAANKCVLYRRDPFFCDQTSLFTNHLSHCLPLPFASLLEIPFAACRAVALAKAGSLFCAFCAFSPLLNLSTSHPFDTPEACSGRAFPTNH